MAAPKLPAAARRAQVLFVRLTAAEKGLIERAAQYARLSITRYCRGVLLDTARLAVMDDTPEDRP